MIHLFIIQNKLIIQCQKEYMVASLEYLLIVGITCPFPSMMSQEGSGHGPRGIA